MYKITQTWPVAGAAALLSACHVVAARVSRSTSLLCAAPGAARLYRILERLACAGIGVTAWDATSAGVSSAGANPTERREALARPATMEKACSRARHAAHTEGECGDSGGLHNHLFPRLRIARLPCGTRASVGRVTLVSEQCERRRGQLDAMSDTHKGANAHAASTRAEALGHGAVHLLWRERTSRSGRSLALNVPNPTRETLLLSQTESTITSRVAPRTSCRQGIGGWRQP